MNTDLLLTACAQLGSIMGATWPLTEAIGAKVRLGKFWISLIVGSLLSMAAYGLGWFNALPAATATAIPIAGFRGYLSAGFAGFIAAVLTSMGHKAFVGSRSATP